MLTFLVTWLTGGNHRLAIVSTGLFFVSRLALVNVKRGIEAAASANGKGRRSVRLTGEGTWRSGPRPMFRSR
jgi:hypothetical protein